MFWEATLCIRYDRRFSVKRGLARTFQRRLREPSPSQEPAFPFRLYMCVEIVAIPRKSGAHDVATYQWRVTA